MLFTTFKAWHSSLISRQVRIICGGLGGYDNIMRELKKLGRRYEQEANFSRDGIGFMAGEFGMQPPRCVE